jgi:large-conductance mechanosensitive channel
MGDCKCSLDNGDIGKKILGIFLCTKTNQCFVTHVVERILPVLFWLSIVGSFVFAVKIGSVSGKITSYSGAFDFGTFIVSLIVLLAYVLIIFYFLFLLKDVRDRLKNEGGCECGCESEPTKAETTVANAVAPKKRGRKPGSKNKTKAAK